MSAGSVLTLGYGPSGNAGKVLRLGYGPSVVVPPPEPVPSILGGSAFFVPETAIEIRHAGAVRVSGGGQVRVSAHKESEQMSPQDQAFLFVMLSD